MSALTKSRPVCSYTPTEKKIHHLLDEHHLFKQAQSIIHLRHKTAFMACNHNASTVHGREPYIATAEQRTIAHHCAPSANIIARLYNRVNHNHLDNLYSMIYPV